MGLVHQVMGSEGDAVDPALPTVAAQLRLGKLAPLHRQQHRRSHCAAHVGKASPLLPGGVFHAVGLGHGDRRVHQQCLDHVPGVRAVKAELLPDVLESHRRHGRQLGRGHGGAAQLAIGPVVPGGVHIPAHSGKVWLQGQVRQRPPAGKIAEPPAILRPRGARLRRHCQRPRAILPRRGDEPLAVFPCRQHAGAVILPHTAEVHEHSTVLVVADDDSRRPGGAGVGILLREGDLSPADDCDFSGHINTCKVFFPASSGHHEKFIFSVLTALLRRQRGKAPQPKGCALIADGYKVAARQRHAVGQRPRAVHAGHRQHAGQGRRVVHRAHVDVGRCPEIRAAHVAVSGAVVVARGGTHDDPRLCGGVKRLDVGHRSAGKPGGGAKTHVDHVRAQQHRILQRRQQHSFRRTVLAIAEHLHDEQLGLRRKAGNISVRPVCPDNARHMGAVVALTVVVMGHVGAPVGVVKGKGDLAADVHVLRRQAVVLPGGVQAVQHLRHGAAVQHGGVRVWVGLKGGMVRVQPGVNDGHHRPRAVVTSGPCGVRPHHIQRGQVLPGGHRLSAPGAVRRGKALRRVDGHYAVQCPNAVQSIIGHDHRHGVDRHEIAVLRRQAVCSGQLGDLLQQCVLLRGNVRPADGTLSLRRRQHRRGRQLHNGLHRRFSLRSVQTSGNVRHNVGGLKGNGGSLLRCSRPGGTNCPCQQGRRQKCRDLFSHGYRPFGM